MGQRHKTRRKTRQKKRRGQGHSSKKTKPKTTPEFLCPAGGARTTQETQGKAETEGQKNKQNYNNNKNKTKDHKKRNKFEHRVTQPTQRCRLRGVPSTWQGTGQHSKKRTYSVVYCNALSSSHWETQLERRPVPRFGGFLDFLGPV